MKIMNIYTFYLRTWLFREFEQDCKEFHKHVIQSILKNYEEYGVFRQREEMEQQIRKNEVSPVLLSKILQVKELNMQLIGLYGEKYFSIVKNQINLRTGAIIGLTEEEKSKIDLVSSYLEKGERLIFKNEEKYWEYKLMQTEARKHNYGDTIFKIIFIWQLLNTILHHLHSNFHSKIMEEMKNPSSFLSFFNVAYSSSFA